MMQHVHNIASINVAVFCSEAPQTEKKPSPSFCFTLYLFYFAFLCKSLSIINLSSFWNKPIMNLQEKCIFSWGKKKKTTIMY